jgi:hypothetical protein
LVKIFHFLFAFYFFLLPCFPCTDAIECEEKSAVPVTIIASSEHEHHHEKESCSPFCFCNCCGQVSVTGYPLFKPTYTLHAIASKQTFRIGHQIVLSGFHNNVWQPPKHCWWILQVILVICNAFPA